MSWRRDDRQACAVTPLTADAKLISRNRRATQYFSRDSHNRTSREFASPSYFNRVNAAKIEREIVLVERAFSRLHKILAVPCGRAALD
jgi:hypothetical protein